MRRSVQVVKSFVVNSWRNFCQKCTQVKQVVVRKLDQMASFLFNALEQDIKKLYALYVGVLVLAGTLVFSLTFPGEIVEPIFLVLFSAFILVIIKKTESRIILNDMFETKEILKWFSSMVISAFVMAIFVFIGIDIGCSTIIEYAFKIYSTATATHCIVVVIGLIALFVKGVWLTRFVAYVSFILQMLLTTNPVEKVVALIYVIIFSFFFMGKLAISNGRVINDIRIDIQQNNPQFYSLLSKIKQFFEALWRRISTFLVRGWRQIIS